MAGVNRSVAHMTAAVAWSLAQDCISIISSLAEPHTMAKRTIDEDVHHFANDKCRTDFEHVCKLLKKQHKERPNTMHITKELLVSVNGPAPSQKLTLEKTHSASWGVFVKMPVTKKQDMILLRCLQIEAQYIKIWKIRESEIIQQLFESEFGITEKFQWPQGKCHVHGVIDSVLIKGD